MRPTASRPQGCVIEMSLSLGNWADKLSCDMCDGGGDDGDGPDFDLDPDYDMGGDQPDWLGDPVDDYEWGPDWPEPDYWPTYEGTDGGAIFGVGGRF